MALIYPGELLKLIAMKITATCVYFPNLCLFSVVALTWVDQSSSYTGVLFYCKLNAR